MACACFDKITCIFRRDPAPDLQTARILPKRRKCLGSVLLIKGRILGVEQDHMSPRKPVPFVQLRIICRVQLRSKIGLCLISLIRQAASYDLFYFSIMYINARSEFHVPAPVLPHFLVRFPQRSISSGPRLPCHFDT